jgi:protein-S-isoprenylcysteine O-methyltransferase Ste14
MGLLVLLYGILCYIAFLATFLYLVAFVGDLGVPRSVSQGPVTGASLALGVDLALLGLFAVQHSVMARPGFKRAWARLVAPDLERSTYVLLSSAALALLFAGWRPLPAVVWSFPSPALRAALWGAFGAGVALALYSTFLISHFDLFGLRQVWFAFREQPYHEQPFRAGTLYGVVRHPLMLGFLLTFWATPRMTAGHLLFAGTMTAYIALGTFLEERDLLRTLGPAYAAYRKRVPKFFPGLAPCRRPWSRGPRRADRR